jgi:ferredoxin/coenzyme F420-reducing hydrogenase delta subunit
VLRALESIWLRLDRCFERHLTAAGNPLAQLGAIANTCLITAVLSGVLLLVWYTPSVHQAHESLERFRGAWFSPGQWVRSVHRYSSDGCILFILLHSARIVCQRRFTGARWIAWVTGILMLLALWFIGWTGYWLVWDVRAHHAALGTARFLDPLPIFAEPLSRSFLADESVPSLLFFLIFFAHMLLPLGVGIGIWMHLTRVSRPRFLTGRTMTLAIAGSLTLVSLILPATSAPAAHMTVRSPGFTIDTWYLWPFWITDRLEGGSLWAVFLSGSLAALTVPWTLRRRAGAPGWTATVDLPRCFGCTLCSQDCPFNAITMVPRQDAARFEVQSQVDPALCVGCGVCVGACDSQAIQIPALATRAREASIHQWIDAVKAELGRPFLAYCCAESAGAMASIPGLDGYRVEVVPCVGWVSAVMLERPLNRGAEGILVVACVESEGPGRDGCRWLEQRLAGSRQPAFIRAVADLSRVRVVHLDRTHPGDFVREAARFRTEPGPAAPLAAPGPAKRWAAGLLLAALFSAATWLGSDLPYRDVPSAGSELVVSFNHHGLVAVPSQLTHSEIEKRLPHMRAQVSVSRERVPVRLRVLVDGQVRHQQAYIAKGLSKDGPSVGLLRLPVDSGTHSIAVDLGDTADATEWDHHWKGDLEFRQDRVRVILFDTQHGYSVH